MARLLRKKDKAPVEEEAEAEEEAEETEPKEKIIVYTAEQVILNNLDAIMKQLTELTEKINEALES